MRAITVVVMAAVLAAVATAQTCVDPSGDPFTSNTNSNCTVVTTCGAAACTCVGGTVSNTGSCSLSTAPSCATATSCFTTYTTCLLTATNSRNNASDPCMSYGNNLYIAQLAAVASTTLNQSTLYGGCAYKMCSLANGTGVSSSCGLAAAVCTASSLLPSTTTAAPGTLAPNQVAALIATLRISGSNWSAVLSSPTLKAQLIASLTTDLATLLGVTAAFIDILSLTVGSLIVNFAVLAGSGKTPAQLNTAVNTATTSSTWLANTQSVYSQVSNETLTTLSVSVTQTEAPTTAAPGSAAGVAGLWMVAALAAIAALWA